MKRRLLTVGSPSLGGPSSSLLLDDRLDLAILDLPELLGGDVRPGHAWARRRPFDRRRGAARPADLVGAETAAWFAGMGLSLGLVG